MSRLRIPGLKGSESSLRIKRRIPIENRRTSGSGNVFFYGRLFLIGTFSALLALQTEGGTDKSHVKRFLTSRPVMLNDDAQ